ncbi:MAG TPA: hypothetical protein VMW36_10900 [Patescibacteria group bacterium]|nr:hypothetical protein [Patescibacteria group bacterium]
MKNLLTIINPLVELMSAFSLSPLQVKTQLSSNSIKTLAAFLNIYHVSIYDCILLISGSAILLLDVSGHRQCLPKTSETVIYGSAQTLITLFRSVLGLIMLGGVIWIFFPKKEL